MDAKVKFYNASHSQNKSQYVSGLTNDIVETMIVLVPSFVYQ